MIEYTTKLIYEPSHIISKYEWSNEDSNSTKILSAYINWAPLADERFSFALAVEKKIISLFVHFLGTLEEYKYEFANNFP